VDSLNGGDGIDTVDYSSDTVGVTASIAGLTASGSSIGSDTFSGIENLIGGNGADTFSGDAADNQLWAATTTTPSPAPTAPDTIDGGAWQ
jgi:hypothetical protein